MVSLLLQILAVLVAMPLLDGGAIGRIVIAAIVAYWCGAIIILFRRPQQPTRWDYLFVTLGFPLTLAVSFEIGILLWPSIAGMFPHVLM